MFKFKELKQIHLEISSNCQASCPMCVRNVHGGLTNESLPINTWTLDQYKTIISEEVIKQASLLYFCGNYGDPLMANDLIEMIQYTVNVKPTIDIHIHTNGSLRSATWWKELAKVLPVRHSVTFAIDGLSDTHTLYRIGTDFHKVIQNAEAFISAGGYAEWAYLRFKHNEHQVEEAKQLAKKLNFSKFIMKDSSRFLLDANFPVVDKEGKTIYHLNPSQYSEIKFIDKKVIENYKNIVKLTKVDCKVLRTKEIFITAQGHVLPCCWLASVAYQPSYPNDIITPVKQEMLNQYNKMIDSLGGLSKLDATKQTIQQIIESTEYQSVWDNYWNREKLITCVRSCGVLPEVFSTSADQFRSIEKLNE